MHLTQLLTWLLKRSIQFTTINTKGFVNLRFDRLAPGGLISCERELAHTQVQDGVVRDLTNLEIQNALVDLMAEMDEKTKIADANRDKQDGDNQNQKMEKEENANS